MEMYGTKKHSYGETTGAPMKLSATFCKRVNRPGVFGDGRGGHGLALRCWRRADGSIGKAWTQRVRIAGRPTNLGLGPYPVVTLAESRKVALGNRRAIRQGRDPRTPDVPTFAEAAEKVIALRALSWRPGTARKWRALLERYAFPRIGGKPVDAITSADILAILSPLWKSKPATAKTVRMRVNVIMQWCTASGFRRDNPAGKAIAAALPKNGGAVHQRALPHGEVANALRKVRASGATSGTKLALQFLVLTAARSSEARGATWSEIDMETATWTIPAARMKSKREHRVPLSSRAMAILRETQALPGSGDLIFRSRHAGKQISGPALTRLLPRLGLDCVPHGFRTSFRSWAAERGVDRAVAEAAIAHTVRGTEGAYQRSDLLERRREVMEGWARYVTGATKEPRTR